MAIVYLAPATNRPTGGVKVLYRHVELLDRQGVNCCVFHPSDPGFTCSWFDHNARVKKKLGFDRTRDFFVVPEMWANTSGNQCVEQQARFAIFVQNGYLFAQGFDPSTYDRLRKVYEAADLILSISDDTTSMIKLAFPSLDSDKIVRVQLSVGGVFGGITMPRKKLISYMPRRLPQHSELMNFFIREYLPAGWGIQAVDGLPEAGVAEKFSESSIFWSFSAMEGVGLPPIEAALCGNVVVGYTGEAGKEYFESPVFNEVHNGDVKSFIQKTLEAIKYIEDGGLSSPAFVEGLAKLATTYSRENEKARLLEFAKRVESLF
ncbi:glycosyltransferase [Kordiimonas sp.]|uniref:glycosyltransferase n=1 Tax=Kordiimonas sp. TaxID=1970157 RepID=UPI003A919F82